MLLPLIGLGSDKDQVHLASRTHFVDLVIHDICSQKIIPYFVDLVIHNICSQKILPYFHKWSSSIRNFAKWSTFCLSLLTLFFCSISFPSFYPLDIFFFQQFFSLRILFTFFSWLLFLENMIICIVQILPSLLPPRIALWENKFLK